MSRINLSQRIIIESGIYQRLNLTEIANKIDMSVAAVSNEIKLNRTPAKGSKPHGNDCRFANECEERIFAATLTANANVFGALTLIAESFATSTTTPPALFSKSRRMFAMFVPAAGIANATGFTTWRTKQTRCPKSVIPRRERKPTQTRMS